MKKTKFPKVSLVEFNITNFSEIPNQSYLTSVYIPSAVTTIGKNAFKNSSRVKSLKTETEEWSERQEETWRQRYYGSKRKSI